MDLPRVNFNEESLKMQEIYRDEIYMDEISSRTLCESTPEKVKNIYGELFLPQSQHDNRPYLYTSFVFSLDGKIAFPDNPEGPVISSNNFINSQGGKADFWFLNVLRSYADVVVVGAQTLQAEPEGTSHVFDQDLVEAREETLQKDFSHPVNLVITLDGTDVPLDHDIFFSDELITWVHTSPAGVDYLKENWNRKLNIVRNVNDFMDGDVYNKDIITIICTGKSDNTDPQELMKILNERNINSVLVESPAYTWELISKEMIDEMFINYSGLYVGGELGFGKNSSFTSENHPHARLVKISFKSPNFLYTRQKMDYTKYEKEEG